MGDQRTYKIIGAAMEVQSTDYPDEIEKQKAFHGAGADLRRLKNVFGMDYMGKKKQPNNLNVARNYTRAPKAESIQLVKRGKQKNNRISTASTGGGHKEPTINNFAIICLMQT